MNLAAAQDEHARLRPYADALVEGTRRISHAALAERIARTARHLRESGIGNGTLIGVALGDHAEHLIIMVALARIGAVLLPLDYRWTSGEQGRVVAHFGAQCVLVEPGRALADVRCIAVDGAWHAAVDAARPDTHIAPGGDAPLLLSLSSGTTGRPKGPRISHAHFQARFRTHLINFGYTPDDRFVSATPLYFGGGRTFAWSTLHAGGTVIFTAPPFDAANLVATVERENATHLFLVPTQLRRLVAEIPGHPALGRLRLLLSSGAPLSRDERLAIRDRLNPNFHEYYGSTEGGGITLLAPADLADHADSVGRPIHGVEIEVVDDTHRALPAGSVGRLRYRSPGCATGFHRDPEASAEAFHDGWFYPGDLAHVDAAGYLTLAGRAKDMIIRGGINIYPEEIEAVLRMHAAVADAAVVGFSAPDMGEEVAAFVVTAATVSDEDLRAWCAARLAPYKLPCMFRRVDVLPRNSSGKVQKPVLKASMMTG